MKLSFDWLKDYCDYQGTPRQLADLLRNLGVGIEGIEEVGDDVSLSLEITSNRNDLNGIVGIARDVAAATGARFKTPDVRFKGSDIKVEALTSVEVHAPDLCPRYTARMITGVKVGPSPEWMRRRLMAIGLRPINNIVDITNYVLYEACQPLHAFDFQKLAGGKIIVRRAQLGETITAIDGTLCKLTSDMLVIADAARPVATAGVMGGRDTEVADSTTTVLLESASFAPVSVRRTARGLGLSTDSSFRFEHGVDPVGVDIASRRAAALMEELAGGTTAQGFIDLWKSPFQPRKVTVRVPHIERVLDLPVSSQRSRDILASLQLKVLEADEGRITVEVPSFRPDLEREIDLIEEIARLEGYNKIPTRIQLPVRPAFHAKREAVEQVMHDVVLGFGFDEAITVSFLPAKLAEQVSPWSDGPCVTVKDSLRKEEDTLRRSLIPHLLQVKQTNENHGTYKVRIYEVAQVYLRERPGAESQERRVLGILHDEEFGETKGLLETLAEKLQIPGPVAFGPCKVPFLQSDSAAVWKCGDRVLGYLGTPADGLVKHFDLRHAPSVAEVDLEALFDLASLERQFVPPPKFPGTDRDIAIVLPESVTWEQIVKSVRASGVPDLRSIEFFDLFRGKSIEKGKKSVAFRLVFQSPERTLTNDEVNAHRDVVVARLEKDLAAKLR